jgi:hypothetical protein
MTLPPSPASVHPSADTHEPYNGPQPVWRCSYCSHWEPRNGEPVACCPYCLNDHGTRVTVMTATIRTEPVASPAWGTAFEDL